MQKSITLPNIPDKPNDPYWEILANQIRSTPEYQKLKFHPKAGSIENDVQYFFDGSLTTFPWGNDVLHWLINAVKGVSEPQEVYPFLKIVNTLPNDSIIVELGAGWALYSILAGQRLPDAKLYLVEAHNELIKITEKNLALNGLTNRSQIVHAAA